MLVIGYGIGENFFVFDLFVLLSVICCFVYLEEGDVVEIICILVDIYDCNGNKVECEIYEGNFE